MKKLLIETNLHNILGKTIFAGCLALWACVMLSNCTSSPSAPSEPEKAPNNTLVYNLSYVSDSLEDVQKSCHYNNLGKDSLKIDGKKYTVSNRSRYRLTTEPDLFGDTEGEGPIVLIDEKFFLDTKTNKILVLNICK